MDVADLVELHSLPLPDDVDVNYTPRSNTRSCPPLPHEHGQKHVGSVSDAVLREAERRKNGVPQPTTHENELWFKSHNKKSSKRVLPSEKTRYDLLFDLLGSPLTRPPLPLYGFFKASDAPVLK